MSSAYFKRATAAVYPIFLVDSASRPTGKTGASPSVQVSKDGGAFGAIAGSVTEIGSGFYKVTLAAADLDARSVAIKATASGADPWNDIFLTDTVLVSETGGESGLQIVHGGGDSVWTKEEKDKVLKRTARILELVQAAPAQVKEVAERLAGQAQAREAAIVATVESLQADARASVRDALEAMRTIIESLPASVRDQARASELVLRDRLIAMEAKMAGRAHTTSQELAGLQEDFERAKISLDWITRAMTASLGTEVLEHLAEQEQQPAGAEQT